MIRDLVESITRAMPGFAVGIGESDPSDGHASLTVSGRSYPNRAQQLGMNEQYESYPALMLTASNHGQEPVVVGDSPWLSGVHV